MLSIICFSFPDWSAMNEITHISVVLLLVILMYFAWMDVALYYKLQSQRSNLLLTQNYAELATSLNKVGTFFKDLL